MCPDLRYWILNCRFSSQKTPPGCEMWLFVQDMYCSFFALKGFTYSWYQCSKHCSPCDFSGNYCQIVQLGWKGWIPEFSPQEAKLFEIKRNFIARESQKTTCDGLILGCGDWQWRMEMLSRKTFTCVNFLVRINIVLECRHGICPKFYTAGFSG